MSVGLVLLVCSSGLASEKAGKCAGSGLGLKYVWGDALTDAADCVGPNDMEYPS